MVEFKVGGDMAEGAHNIHSPEHHELMKRIGELADPGVAAGVPADRYRHGLVQRLQFKDGQGVDAVTRKTEPAAVIGELLVEVGIVDRSEREQLDLFVSQRAAEFGDNLEPSAPHDITLEARREAAALAVPADSVFTRTFDALRREADDFWDGLPNIKTLLDHAESLGDFVVAYCSSDPEDLPQPN